MSLPTPPSTGMAQPEGRGPFSSSASWLVGFLPTPTDSPVHLSAIMSIYLNMLWNQLLPSKSLFLAEDVPDLTGKVRHASLAPSLPPSSSC